MASALTFGGIKGMLVANIAHLANGVALNPTGCFALVKSYDAYPNGVHLCATVTTVFNGTFGKLGDVISSLAIYDRSEDVSLSAASFAKTGCRRTPRYDVPADNVLSTVMRAVALTRWSYFNPDQVR
jgi:hypothetical protein